MKKALALGVVLLVTVGVVGLIAFKPAPVEIRTGQNEFSQNVIGVVNSNRTVAGHKPLEQNFSLQRAASIAAGQIENKNSSALGDVTVPLQGNDSQIFSTRIPLFSAGKDTPSEVVDVWLQDVIGKQTILNPLMDSYGIAAVRSSDGVMFVFLLVGKKKVI